MDIKLEKVRVEPVYDYLELADVETALSRYHPLGAKKAIGRRITYVAIHEGFWVGVLIFDKAVDRNKRREERIGWSGDQVSTSLE